MTAATQTPEGGSAPSSATEVPSARPPACCPGRHSTAARVRAWWAERVAWRWSA